MSVDLSVAGSVATVTLNRPAHGNAIDVAMADALLQHAIAVDRDPGVRAVILRAEGKFFCAGGDVGAFAAEHDAMPDLLLRITTPLHGAILRFARMDKPLVTEVQGFAAGGGFGLAMLGDIVVASEAAQFTLAYTGIGLTPDAGATWLLPRLVGLRQAQRMMMLNQRLDASAALAAGLVSEVVPQGNLRERVAAIAEQVAAGPTGAYGRIRDLLLDSLSNSFERQLEAEARAIADCGGTADGRAGVAAFLNKTPPAFSGA